MQIVRSYMVPPNVQATITAGAGQATPKDIRRLVSLAVARRCHIQGELRTACGTRHAETRIGKVIVGCHSSVDYRCSICIDYMFLPWSILTTNMIV